MKAVCRVLFFSTIFFALQANARVFDYNSAWMSAYFRGTGGESSVGKDLFADTSGNSTGFNDGASYNLSGEIGLAFHMGTRFTVRAGVEGLQTKNVTVTGKHIVTGVEHMELESKAVAFNPNLTMELALSSLGGLRFFTFAGAGYATVKVGNDYDMTTAGTTLYGGSDLFSDEWAAEVMSYHAGVGAEWHALDNVTILMDLGWRGMEIPEFEHTANAAVIRNGASVNVTKGQTVTDNNGNKVSLDLSGVFVGIAFRFYMPQLN